MTGGGRGRKCMPGCRSSLVSGKSLPISVCDPSFSLINSFLKQHPMPPQLKAEADMLRILKLKLCCKLANLLPQAITFQRVQTIFSMKTCPILFFCIQIFNRKNHKDNPSQQIKTHMIGIQIYYKRVFCNLPQIHTKKSNQRSHAAVKISSLLTLSIGRSCML